MPIGKRYKSALTWCWYCLEILGRLASGSCRKAGNNKQLNRSPSRLRSVPYAWSHDPPGPKSASGAPIDPDYSPTAMVFTLNGSCGLIEHRRLNLRSIFPETVSVYSWLVSRLLPNLKPKSLGEAALVCGFLRVFLGRIVLFL
jgi:hypothetical protein